MNEKRGRGFSNNRGQITIFIILGLIIVGASALVYFLYPTIKSTFIGITDPQGFIQTCMQDEITSTIRNLSVQGGSMSPQNYFLYYNPDQNRAYDVEYLCYTNQYYIPCVMQQPLLQAHVEDEIIKNIQKTATSCFSELQKSYQKRGYSVDFAEGKTVVDILPQRTLVTFNNKLTLTKDTSQRYENFTVMVNNNLYEFLAIATSILNWEATYGDAPVQNYMIYYHDLIVEKKIVGSSQDPNNKGLNTDGTKIYILTNTNTGSIFQFATRSGAFPAGIKQK